MSYPYGKSFTANSVLSAPSPLPPRFHQKNPFIPYKKPLFAPSLSMLPQAGFPSHLLLTSPPRSSCRIITGCLSFTPTPLLHIEALLPPLRITLTYQFLSFFERALRLPSTFPIASLANSNPRTKDSPPFAIPQLAPSFPPYLTTISLAGLTVRYLAGWGRVVQGYTSSVQSVSMLPCSPSRLVSGLPVIVPRLLLSYMLLSSVSLTPRHVILNLSLFFPILYLPPNIFNPQIPIQYTIPSQFSIPIQGSPSAMDTRSLFPPR